MEQLKISLGTGLYCDNCGAETRMSADGTTECMALAVALDMFVELLIGREVLIKCTSCEVWYSAKVKENSRAI